MLEPQIHLALDRMSNDQFDQLEILDQYIDEAGEALKEVLRHQMTPNDGAFGLRMSNVGKTPVPVADGCFWRSAF